MKTDDYKAKYEDALARLSDVVQERSELRQINAELVEALKCYTQCPASCTCGDGWSHDTAISAIAKANTLKEFQNAKRT